MVDSSIEKTLPEGKFLAILFVDIDGSTKLYDVYGNEDARRFTADCIGGMNSAVGEEGGTVVKSLGDGIMCVFPTADAALRAATRIREDRKDQELTVHAGAHFGQVIEEGGDVFGDAVNVAARVAELAKAGEILVTEDTVMNLSPPLRGSTRWLDNTAVKGKQDPVGIYAVVADEDNATVITGGIDLAELGVCGLYLTFEGQEYSLQAPKTEFLIGRDPSCDLAVGGNYASRQHARIELTRGKFFLKDHSTNGTYVRQGSDELLFLKRDLVQLQMVGEISLGRVPEMAPDSLIRYRII